MNFYERVQMPETPRILQTTPEADCSGSYIYKITKEDFENSKSSQIHFKISLANVLFQRYTWCECFLLTVCSYRRLCSALLLILANTLMNQVRMEDRYLIRGLPL